MIANAACDHDKAHKHGKDRRGQQRFKCVSCGSTFTEERTKPIGDMRIEIDRAVLALTLLVEGMSIRAAERITKLHRDTIDDLILVVGENCSRFLDRFVVNVPSVSDVEIDEIWSFVGCKNKLARERNYGPDKGDSWTFTAIERNTKLVLAHYVGHRNAMSADRFLRKVKNATNGAGRYQVTTDGLAVYEYGVPFALGSNIDFAQLIKKYASGQTEIRYSPDVITACERVPRFGNPEYDRISTSIVERLNLTIRMQSRRHTRLTNAHSKSLRHHTAMQAILFAWYNLIRRHETVKTTPAVASDLTDHAWTFRELLDNAADWHGENC